MANYQIMISFHEKLRGFVEGFSLKFVQNSHQIFFWNLGSGLDKDSVIFTNDLGWIRIPKKGFGLITTGSSLQCTEVTREVPRFTRG